MPQEFREVVIIVCLCACCMCDWESVSACWDCGVRGQFVRTVLLFKDLFVTIAGIAQGLVSLPVFMPAVLQSWLQYFDWVTPSGCFFFF